MKLMLLSAIAGGGAIGATARYTIDRVIAHFLGTNFPYGVFFVNHLGSFLFGLVIGFALKSPQASPVLMTGLTTGFLGALTTFSTFSYQTIALLEDGEFLKASFYWGGQVFFCPIFYWAGWKLTATLLATASS